VRRGLTIHNEDEQDEMMMDEAMQVHTPDGYRMTCGNHIPRIEK
jgi:hypothetical protein